MSDLRVDGGSDPGTPSKRDPDSSSSSVPPLAARLVEPPLDREDEETPCPKRADGQHCNCWYDGDPCCACHASGLPYVQIDFSCGCSTPFFLSEEECTTLRCDVHRDGYPVRLRAPVCRPSLPVGRLVDPYPPRNLIERLDRAMEGLQDLVKPTPLDHLRDALSDCLEIIEPLREELFQQGRWDAAKCCGEVIAYSRGALQTARGDPSPQLQTIEAVIRRCHETFDPGGNLPADCDEWVEAHARALAELGALCLAATVALQSIVDLDLGKDARGRDDFYTGPDRFFRAHAIAREALLAARVDPSPLAQLSENTDDQARGGKGVNRHGQDLPQRPTGDK